MSRSRKKSPVGGFTTAESEKDFKRDCNSTFRARQRRLIQKIHQEPDGDTDIHLPRHLRDVVEPWSGPKDGKCYFGNMDDKAYIKKHMRK